MKVKIRETIITIITIIINISLGLLISNSLFDNTYFAMVTIGFVLITTGLLLAISKKLGYKLDIFAYNIDDLKLSVLNSIFIGNIISIPLIMFVFLFI